MDKTSFFLRPRPSSVLAVAVVWGVLLLGSAAPASADVISLDLDAICITGPESVGVEVVLRSRGDEAAREVHVAASLKDRVARSGRLGNIAPGRTQKTILNLGAPPGEPGAYTILVRARFQGPDGRPFSAVGSCAFAHDRPALPGVLPEVESFTVAGRGRMRVILHNVDDQARQVSLHVHAPLELWMEKGRARAISVPAGGVRKVDVPLMNVAGNVGADYPVVVVAEYRDRGVHYSHAATASARIQPARYFFQTHRRWLWIAGGLCLLAALTPVGRLGRLGLALPYLTPILVAGFAVSFMHPEWMLADVIPTGGDTASHYPTAAHVRDWMTGGGRLFGWNPGHYAGFPMFEMYFPAPFLAMGVLSLMVPLTVAFKLIAALGIVALLPAAVYFLKCLGLKNTTAAAGPALVLTFLFMESNSAWGGNILSNLSGEFCFSWGLALAWVYLGLLFRRVDRRDGVAVSAVILALTGLCHGYPLLFAVLGSGFFLLTTRDWVDRLIWLLKINVLAFCLMGFWIVPLLWYAPWTTPFNFVWSIDGWRTVWPIILWPAGLLAVGGLVWNLWAASRRRAFFLIYLMVLSGVFYFIGYKIGLVDVRFIPFGQVTVVLAAALGLDPVLTRVRTPVLVVVGLTAAAMAWSGNWTEKIGPWSAWNYSGWRVKPLYQDFQRVNRHLSGDWGDPRVVYEHSSVALWAGTVRAFESLPFFAGRATLEGPYIQACLSPPFVFYIQSLVSPRFSAPLIQYNYGRFDLEAARPRLELFNVGQYITQTESARQRALDHPAFEPVFESPSFAVFNLKTHQNRYVTQPRYQPVLVTGAGAKRMAFEWFRRTDLAVPLVFADDPGRTPESAFAETIPAAHLEQRLPDLPRHPIPPNENLRETVRANEIVIDGARPGRPLWVRVSYHPDWRVDGAAGVFRASPSFMLVFPEKERVRLYFGRGRAEYAGWVLFGAGLIFLIRGILVPPAGARWEQSLTAALRPLSARAAPHARIILAAAVSLLVAGAAFMVLAVGYDEPRIYYRRGQKLYTEGQYQRARAVLRRGLTRHPRSPVVGQTMHHLALTHWRQSDWAAAAGVWRALVEEYPESRVAPEALYHLGLSRLRVGQPERAASVWKDLMERFPDSDWSRRARIELDRLSDKDDP